ncbi:hypothetical protein CATRI_03870 [Corynebacterium atrinae]|uniref:hypothetical protein n=1 Tax=Corynebacterium atrinae TaxID=1336740 RepID=UPI0025B5255C|nr:hypothetical protein [Corynebacterium atrinae]WJY62872.1 hypothetical protein CATRI_03870 [Corynebacterium atrinae]
MKVSIRICLVMIASLSISSCVYRTAQLDVDAPPEVVAREVVKDLDHGHDEGFNVKTTRDANAPVPKLNEWPVRDLGWDEEIRGLRSDMVIPEGCSLNRRAEIESREGGRGYLVDVPLRCEDGREVFVTFEVTREQPHKVFMVPVTSTGVLNVRNTMTLPLASSTDYGRQNYADIATVGVLAHRKTLNGRADFLSRSGK